jgi:hypothetical protein
MCAGSNPAEGAFRCRETSETETARAEAGGSKPAHCSTGSVAARLPGEFVPRSLEGVSVRTRSVLAFVIGAAMAGIGLPVILAGPAAAITVSTEAELRAAFGDVSETQIDLAADVDVTCGGGGELVRNSATPLTIDGHGFTVTGTCPDNGIFEQDGTGPLTLTNILLTGGDTNGSGGAVFSNGDVTAIDTIITGNGANSAGGGLFSAGTLQLTRSSVTGNSSSTGGGGIFSTGAINVVDSTIADNPSGGGIGSGGDVSVTVVNSTISGNAAVTGGGIFTEGALTLVYATVANNSASAFANLDAETLTSFASVVALPQGGGINCLTSTTSNGYNYSDDPSCGFGSGTGDVTDGPDPQLGALGDNGGPTPTMEPAAGSPLLDVIPVASCEADGAAAITADQRGISRPQGSGCDIGAVEVEVAAPVPPAPPAPPPVPVAAVARFTG